MGERKDDTVNNKVGRRTLSKKEKRRRVEGKREMNW